ncbi:MAG: hypothetical protein HYW90_03055 [Candidatus Sungbacteria bacterium]|nr:hypothetical protein [Candidatus Sungbacteria bacterium]
MKLRIIRGKEKRIPIRLPLPPVGRPHSTPKGARGYNRSETRRLERAAKEGRDE